MSTIKLKRIKQAVDTGVTQPLSIGGVASDNSDEVMNIASNGDLQIKKIIQTNGIKFPATQVASSDPNTLDDYEEGTFTPVLVGQETNPTVTYGNRYGSYTKVGRLVTCHVMISATITVGGSGGLSFTLPFIAQNSPLTHAHTRVGWVNSALTIIPTGISPIHNDNKSSLYSGTHANVIIGANGIGEILFATMFSYFTD